MRHSILYFLFFLAFPGCNSDGESIDPEYNYCNNFSQTEDVTINNVEISILEVNDLSYYSINASITNNVSEPVSGRSTFVIKIFNDFILNEEFIQCTLIPIGETCTFESIIQIPEAGEVDYDVSIECFYYLK